MELLHKLDKEDAKDFESIFSNDASSMGNFDSQVRYALEFYKGKLMEPEGLHIDAVGTQSVVNGEIC